MKIRLEQQADYNQILKLTYEAFLMLDFPGRQHVDEHYLIALLKDSDSVLRELSFVAEKDNEIIGHIVFTRSEVVSSDGKNISTITFGPLSVLPKYQRQGVGKALVTHSLEVAKKLGYNAVIIAGVPEYYPKLGFKRCYEYGLTLPDGTAPDALMVYELIPDVLKGGGVCNFLAPEFVTAETDSIGYKDFHLNFIKANYSGKVMIRSFFDCDIERFEKWLYLPHVAKWYEDPESWLYEIRNRYGEFAFIKHFIVEVNGNPIGFCQYYDCFFGQEHEDWYKVEKECEVFSIDYMIGEQDYLHKGYGKEIISILTSTISRFGAKKIIVLPHDDNVNSRRVLESNGYTKNGDLYELELTPCN